MWNKIEDILVFTETGADREDPVLDDSVTIYSCPELGLENLPRDGRCWVDPKWGKIYGESYSISVDSVLTLIAIHLKGWTVANLSQQDDESWAAELRQGYLTSYDKVVISPSVYKQKPQSAARALLSVALQAMEWEKQNDKTR